MYWLGFSFLVIITLFFLIGLIVCIKDDVDNECTGGLFLVVIACGLVLWFYIETNTYSTGTPKVILPKNVSIMKDSEVAIVRYKTFQKTYETKKEYDAICDSSFILEEVTKYNIQGEENGVNYKLIFK